MELARAVNEAAKRPNNFQFLYNLQVRADTSAWISVWPQFLLLICAVSKVTQDALINYLNGFTRMQLSEPNDIFLFGIMEVVQ